MLGDVGGVSGLILMVNMLGIDDMIVCVNWLVRLLDDDMLLGCVIVFNGLMDWMLWFGGVVDLLI